MTACVDPIAIGFGIALACMGLALLVIVIGEIWCP